MKKILPPEFNNYHPKMVIKIDSNKDLFCIKTAETEEELIGAFHLRHNAFYKHRKGHSLPSELYIDDYDIYADQLIVINKKTKKVIGAYRLIPASVEKAEWFSNQQYFEMEKFLKNKKGTLLEMEWACIDEQERNTSTIRFIWQGLAKYFKEAKSQYIFGQVNVLNSSAEEAIGIYKTLLQHNFADLEASVFPNSKYSIKNFDNHLSKAESDKKKLFKLSRMFWWYLKLGAKVAGRPIHDTKFDSYGFFLHLNFKNISNPRLINRYEDAVKWKKSL